MQYENGFLYPQIDNNKCIDCGLCLKKCQIANGLESTKISKSFIVISKQKEIYDHSSSGGVFGTFAHHFLDLDSSTSSVSGACFTEDFMVKHILASSHDDIMKIQGSKYVQSNLCGIYQNLKDNLERGNKILFSGTPCQVAAVKLLFNKHYSEQLLLVDIVCHGCPSSKLFKEHIDLIKKSKDIHSISFRTKDKYERYGFNLKILYSDNTSDLFFGDEDPFYRLFLKSASFREACYECPYANRNRISDVTIGDCGTSNYITDFHPNETISTIYPITEKGERFLNSSRHLFDILEADTAREVSSNHQLNHPSIRPSVRTEFDKVDAAHLKEWVDAHYGKVATTTKVKNRLKRLIPETYRKLLVRRIKVLFKRS